uniref:Integrase catalytic domain-containing protein n=1 Tax=Haplochromis burtoni TaxID=8153 RepID=A0A3Q2WVM0_HAPBU
CETPCDFITDVKHHVTLCSVCQLTIPNQKKSSRSCGSHCPPETLRVGYVDFVGPVPCTPAGNAYLIVFVDYLNKWVEACAVKEATSQVAAVKFVTDIFARHDTPTYLISDRRSPFVSELFEQVVSALDSVHRLTTAYLPQTNATERFYWTLKTAICSYVGDKHTSWDKFLLQICRELDTPLDLITQPFTAGVDEPGVLYPETLKASPQGTHNQTRAALDYSHGRQKHYYDLRRQHATFRFGDLVRVRTQARSDAQSNFTVKLAPLFEGPLCVSQRLSYVNYRLTWVDSGVDAGVYHVVNMQLFHTWDSLTSKEHSVSSHAVRETTKDLDTDTQAHPAPKRWTNDFHMTGLDLK